MMHAVLFQQGRDSVLMTTVDQRSGANFKKSVFGKILLQISCFFKAFLHKKRWLKYTTHFIHLHARVGLKISNNDLSRLLEDHHRREITGQGKARVTLKKLKNLFGDQGKTA